MATATKEKIAPEEKLKADYQALKQEHSELGRLYELRGRDLAAARKHAAKVDDAEAELAEANEEIDALAKALAEKSREVEDLQAKLAKTDDILEDVAALKRLVG